MRRRSRSRVESVLVNPFVVLSDVTISIILILIFYFTARFFVIGRDLPELIKRNAELTKKNTELSKTVKQFTAAQKWRIETLPEYQQAVRGVLEKPALAPYRKHISERPEGDVQVFTFGAQVLFAINKSELTQHGRTVLGQFDQLLGPVLREKAGQYGTYPEIQVQGHTDTQRADNWTLSTQRALAVVKFLSKRKQLQHYYLSAGGYSCYRPARTPRLNRDQSELRRVEIRLIYSAPATNGGNTSGTFRPGTPFNCDCER